jgi:[acyl-carrier-protein] S-malonyltransferase
MTAWLFPGQGAQEVGMGRALYDSSVAAREVFERADAALGWSISKICFEGPKEELTRTANTQPALVTVSLAALAAIREAHPNLPRPRFTAGHSLGEYSALVAAEALELEDAVRLVHLRGKAMQEAVPEGQGTMAAILASKDEVEAICNEAANGDVLAPANFNAPGQIVIAGHAAAVDRALSLAQERKVRAMPLKVSAPFHCSLMAPAAAVMKQALSEVKVQTPCIPVISNVEAAPNADPRRAAELLVQQVDGPVKWDQSVAHMASAGVQRALEIGPGRVLAGLIRRIDKTIQVLSVGDPESVARVREFLG